jgi:putative ABC transport system permease protein
MPEANKRAPSVGRPVAENRAPLAGGGAGTALAQRLGMDKLLQDLRYAIRSFAKAPGFTALALLTIALGIGVNATVFSFVNALLLRPAPAVRDPGTLVSVFTSDFSSGLFGTSSYPDYLSIKEEAAVFERLAAFTDGAANMAVGNAMYRVRTSSVSPEFFDVLGVTPALGRQLGAGDSAPGAPPVAVIADALWHRAFGGSGSAVGSQVVLDGRSLTVVGVAPPRFSGLNLGVAIEIWTPLPVQSASSRGNRSLEIIGRLRDGSSLRQAQTQLDAIAARLAAEFPQSNRGTLRQPNDPRPMAVRPHTRIHPRFRGEVMMVGATLMTAVVLVLLIACANVAGLLLSRATARGREIAVRLALGARRSRIVRQMLTESLVLGCAGGALGLIVALWTADMLPSYFPPEVADLLEAGVDASVILFTFATAILSGLVFGLAPALHGVRASAVHALAASASRTSESGRVINMRNVLVAAQIAVASVLLVSAGLLARSLTNAMNADLGFSTRQAVMSSIELPSAMTNEQVLAYYDALIADMRTIPGVERASLARVVPVAGGSRRMFSVPGYVPRPGEDMELQVNTVHRDYFATLGMPAVQGRLFESSDAANAPLVVVNDILAHRYFGGQAVGRRIVSGKNELEIIGVVAVQRRSGLQDRPDPVVFYQLGRDLPRRVFLVVSTAGDPLQYAETIRRRATAVDRNVAVFRTVTLEDHLAEAVAANRLTVALVTFCGLMAFVLAAVGVYGIVAYAVERRTREIGIRVALGARPGQVLALLAHEGGRVILAGVVLGLVAALASTRLLTSMLYGISATDPATFLVVPVAVTIIALVATCIPAARVLGINPVAALRHE